MTPFGPTDVAAGPAASPALEESAFRASNSAIAVGSAGPAVTLDPAVTVAGQGDVAADPSVLYEEAMRHAHDLLEFEGGDRVTVGFRPRATDTWEVDGTRPVALPPGRLSGEAMAGTEVMATPDGSPASGPPDPGAEPGAPTDQPGEQVPATTDPARDPLAPVDLPTVPASEAATADGASAVLPGTTADRSAQASAGLRRQVFGFLPYWELNGATVLDYDTLSTIAYFSVGSDRHGNLLKRDPDGTATTGWGGWTSDRLTSIINEAHQRGTRVVLTITMFAWSSSQRAAQAALLASPDARLSLARQTAQAVRDRGADGVNLDFEPLVSGYEDEFVAFVRTLRGELDRFAPGYQITFDTLAELGNYPLADLLAPGGADAVFVMGYDYRTASASSAGSIAPLGGPRYDVTETVARYLARIPPDQVILGVPYYGRAWSTVSDTLNAPTQTGAQYGYSSSVVYDTAAELALQHGRRYDPVEQVAWFVYRRENCSAAYGCVLSWRQVYYDDAQSLRAKYDLVNASGLRGVGIWALGYDGSRPELRAALVEKFIEDRAGPMSGITVLAPAQGDEGFLVRWTARDDSGVRDHDVEVAVDGGAWTPWLSATTATSDIYLGRTGQRYAFRVRATDLKGNVAPWTVTQATAGPASLAPGGFATVRTDGLSARTAPDTSASRVATFAAGDVVAVLDGPRRADGYAWYRVSGPLAEWPAVAPVRTGVWVAASGGSTTHLAARPAPHVTAVDAGIQGLAVGTLSTAAVASPGFSLVAPGRTFSPNADGSGDRVRIRWTNKVALSSLALNVYRPDGSLVGSRALAQRSAGLQTLDWEGAVGGAAPADGSYAIQLVGVAGKATYRAPSARPVTASQLAAYGVTVDRVAPAVVSSSISGSLVSPDGDGVLDTVTATLSAPGASRWVLAVAPRTATGHGTAIRTITGPGETASATWDGTTDTGAPAPQGVYRLTMSGLDEAGNPGSVSWEVTLDTQDPVVAASAAPAVFSPNADGVADTTRLAWSSDVAVRATISVMRGTTVVRRWTTGSSTGTTIAWDGRDRAGRPVADGRYQLVVDAADAAGNRVAVKATVTVDRTAGFLRWSPTTFYPQDGDKLSPTSTVGFRLARTATTSLRIVDATGKVVRNAWLDRARAAGTWTWRWDGRNGQRALVAPGRYTAVLTATSAIGTIELRRTVIADGFLVSSPPATARGGTMLVLAFRTVEPLRTGPTVTLRQPGIAAAKVTATSLGRGRYEARIPIEAGAPGPATITIAARDTASGVNRTDLALTIE